MTKKVLDIDTAKAMCGQYRYVYIRELSRLAMGLAEKKLPVNWDEVIEVRFFDDKGELRFFDSGDGLKAAEITDKSGDDCKDTDYELEHDGKFGKSIIVREYFDYDPDGQIFVTASRLVEWR